MSHTSTACCIIEKKEEQKTSKTKQGPPPPKSKTTNKDTITLRKDILLAEVKQSTDGIQREQNQMKTKQGNGNQKNRNRNRKTRKKVMKVGGKGKKIEREDKRWTTAWENALQSATVDYNRTIPTATATIPIASEPTAAIGTDRPPAPPSSCNRGLPVVVGAVASLALVPAGSVYSTIA